MHCLYSVTRRLARHKIDFATSQVSHPSVSPPRFHDIAQVRLETRLPGDHVHIRICEVSLQCCTGHAALTRATRRPKPEHFVSCAEWVTLSTVLIDAHEAAETAHLHAKELAAPGSRLSRLSSEHDAELQRLAGQGFGMGT